MPPAPGIAGSFFLDAILLLFTSTSVEPPTRMIRNQL
jgi:hypothetical protein